MADRLEGREFVAGGRLEGLHETVAVIGHQHRVVAGPREFDIERRLAGDGALVRIENRDHLIAGDPLCRMDRRGPGMVDEVKLGIVMAKGQRAAVGCLKPQSLRADPEDLRLLAIEEGAFLVVAGPADPLPGMEFDSLRLEEIDPVAQVLRRIGPAGLAVGVLEKNLLSFRPDDVEDVARLRLNAVDIGVEHRDVVFVPVGKVPFLGPGEVEIDVALDLEGSAVQAPLGLEALADGARDLPPANMGGGQHLRGLAGFHVEVEPQGRGPWSEFVRIHLQDTGAEFLNGEIGFLVDHVKHRGLEALVALAHHLVHHRRLHAGLLQHPERLPGLDRAQLRLVAHQGDAGDARRFGDAGEAVHLRHADQRRLVHHEEGAFQGLPGPVQGLMHRRSRRRHRGSG